MKKTYLSTIAIAIAFISTLQLSAQTFYHDYVDGTVHFIIKKDYPLDNGVSSIDGKIKNDIDWNNLDLNYFPFMQKLSEKYQITKLSKPAHAAKESFVLQRTFRVEFSDFHNVEQIIKDLEAIEMVEMAEKAEMCYVEYTPNDPFFNSTQMWGLFKVQADLAWNLSFGNANIVVATTDNAMQVTHPDFAGTIWTNPGEIPNNGIDDDGNGYIDDVNGYDVSDNDNNVMPPTNGHNHGTHVMGTVGARTDNSTGVASIGFGIKNMPVKCARNSSSTSALPNGYDGIVYAGSSGAHVINCSWGGTGNSSYGSSVVSWAIGQGIIIVAAAGNSNSSGNHYPSSYPGVISVGATTSSDTKASFSNYGTTLDVSAPGVNILSLLPTNQYGYLQGTSMASPLVAGLVGLMLSYNPNITPANVLNCLTSTCDPISGPLASSMGAGRVNAFKALQCVGALLNNKPQANFTANVTTVTAGGSVNFTDLSLYNPTSWNWTFTGGTPGTSTTKNPANIVYNTPGTYQVRLIATNSNGSDTATKVAYINVVASNGCDSITNIIATDSLLSVWSAGPSGYLGGTFANNLNTWAEHFTNTTAATHLQYFDIYLARAGSINNTNSFAVAMWTVHPTTGAPDTVKAAVGITYRTIKNITGTGGFVRINFGTPIKIPANNQFFLGLQADKFNPDTLAWGTTPNLNGSGRTGKIWTDVSGGTWQPTQNVFTVSSQPLHLAGWTFAYVTSYPVTAVVTPLTDTICAGDFVNFNASTSPNASSYSWTFNGANLSTSTSATPSVTFANPGIYVQTLRAYNSCGYYDLEYPSITVDPSPNVNVTTSLDTICPGGSAILTATGASTYSWTPTTGLSPTTGAVVTATPASTTTYTVTGTTGNCSDIDNVTINVDVPPTAAFSYSPTSNICPNTPVTFNPNATINASSYNWSFTGGTPSTSNQVFPVITYASSGSYPVFLTASNSCSNDTLTGFITIDVCTGVSTIETKTGVTSYFNPSNKNVQIGMNNVPVGNYQIMVMNAIGQNVIEDNIYVNSKTMLKTYSMEEFSNGVYYIKLFNAEDNFTNKFVKY